MWLAILLGFLIILVVLLLFYRLWFLRNPKRTIPKGENIVSPADGTIARVIPFGQKTAKLTITKGILGKIHALTGDVAKAGYLIVIVMTPVDMHYQKAPCDCRVMGTRHIRGKFYNAVLNAKDLRAAFENEHNMVLLDTKHGRIKIIQIAGFLARRIHCFVRPGQKLKKGEDLGIIKLGSQVCFIMPKLKLKIREGQRVLAASTIIAEP